MPIIETGQDAPVAYGFSDESPRVFVRLRYVDQTYAAPFSTDIDGDGLTNDEEFSHQTDPFSTDTDHDLLDDKTELSLFILTAGDEWSRPLLIPAKADSDDNGILDGLEDYDGDGLTILQEIALGTSPNKTDTDRDGVSDGRELALGTSPLADDQFAALDSDGDGLSDLEEILIGTDRHDADTNDNGMEDGLEFDLGGAPANPGAPVPDLPPPGLPPSPDPLPNPPAPPSPPAAPPALPPVAHRVLVRAVSASHVKHGFAPYQELTPPRRYLTETLSQNFSGGCPESGPVDTSGDKVREIDPDDGVLVETGDDYVTGGGDIRSPYVRRGSIELYSYDDPPNEADECPGTLAVSAVLSDENTTAMLRAAAKGKLPAYSQEAPDDGYREVAPHAYRSLRADELGFAYQRAQVKFAWPANTPEAARHPVTYLVLFEPEDDPDTTENESASPEALTAWTWDGAAAESPVWELDPDTLKPGDRNGRFFLSQLRLHADPGSIHLGFDPPNPSENDPLDEYWASVVQGASNTILNLDLSTTAAAALEWQISEADQARVEFDTTLTGPGKLIITGKNTGANVPEPATLRLIAKGGGATFLTINVLVLPQRMMKLAIYTIEDPDSPLTQFASSPAVIVPSDEAILAVCNNAFEQAGVRFQLHPDRGVRERPYRYDTWGLAPFLAVHRYDSLLPARSPDGLFTEDEKSALIDSFGGAPPPALNPPHSIAHFRRQNSHFITEG